MAKISSSMQSVQTILWSLFYSQVYYDEEQQKLQVGPGGLADGDSLRHPLNETERLQKMQNGLGGLCDKVVPTNSPAETVELIAAAMVGDEIFRQKAQAAFDEGQEKEEDKFAA